MKEPAKIFEGWGRPSTRISLPFPFSHVSPPFLTSTQGSSFPPFSLFLFEIYTAPPFYPYPSDLCNKSPLPFSRGDFIPHSPLNTS